MIWKIYSIIILALSLIGLIALTDFFPLGIYDYIGIIINILGILAAYAYAFNKKLLKSKYWTIIFLILIASIIEEVFEYTAPQLFSSIPYWRSSLSVGLTGVIFTWIIFIPAVYASFKLSTFNKK